jgi:trimeric autotransporter adhesin
MKNLLISCFFLINTSIIAQSLIKVKDINVGAANSLDGSEAPVAVGNISYFTASDGTTGYELWKTDGTTAGTVLVKDINSGAGDSYPSNMTNVAGILFFTADDGANGLELWKSNGTAMGTALVKNIKAGANGSYPSNFLRVDNKLFFVADDGVNGSELWKTDGTTAGTILVKDIYTGMEDSHPKNLTNANGTIFFTATDATNGDELWKTNGTTAGTILVQDIETGIVGSSIHQIVSIGNVIYFQAYNATNGFDLWKSDGITTTLLKDINSGTANADINNLINNNGTLYFRATNGVNGYELWKTDGTTAGTILVKDINITSYGSYPNNITVVNNNTYFTANEGTNGYELWKTDGTTAGTVLVKDIEAGAAGSFPKFLTNVNGKLYFIANTTANGDELWKSDGTAAGTTLIANINSGTVGATAQLLNNNDQQLYFQANETASGNELWKYLDCNIYTLATSGISVTNAIEQGCSFIKNNSCELIAKIYQTGSQPLYNAVLSKVTIDASPTNYGGIVYAQRHYDIEPVSNATNATATIILFFSQAEFNAYNAANGVAPDLPTGPTDNIGIGNLTIAQFHGTGTNPTNYTGSSVLINPADNEIIWNATDNRWEVTFQAFGFSGFYLRGEVGVLALNQIHFTAQKIADHKNSLQWSVDDETLVSQYEIERSFRGNSFEKIGTATSTHIINDNYSFIDNLFSNEEYVYYRLKVIEQAKISYSKTIKLTTKSKNDITIYPIPAHHSITVIKNGAALEDYVVIKNALVSTIQKVILKNSSEQISIAHLPNGFYELHFSNGTVKKFIKQ